MYCVSSLLYKAVFCPLKYVKMKKFFIILFAIIPFLGNAQTVFYKTTEVSVALNGRWQEWQETNDVTVMINFDDWIVKIQTVVPQQYIFSSEPVNIDKETIGNKALDQDGDPCVVKLRAADGEPLQIYVLYGNNGWVYNLRKL